MRLANLPVFKTLAAVRRQVGPSEHWVLLLGLRLQCLQRKSQDLSESVFGNDVPGLAQRVEEAGLQVLVDSELKDE